MKILFTQLPINNTIINNSHKKANVSPAFSARIPADVFEKKQKSQFDFAKFGFTSNDAVAIAEFSEFMKCYPDIRRVSLNNLRLLNDKYKDSEKFLNVIYSQKDKETGNTIFHEADFIVLREINKTLAPYPDLLSNFYFVRNNQDELPIHKVNDYPKNERLKEILKVFENNPASVAKMLASKDSKGKTPYDVVDYKGRRIIHDALKESNPDFLAELYLHHSLNCKNQKETKQSIQGAWDLITNSDLSIDKSLELCHNFVQIAGKDYDFSSAIEYLSSLKK